MPLPPPPARLTCTVRVDQAHLANPVLAIARLLTAEANAYAHVDGDDHRLTISVALPDDRPSTQRVVEAWIRWVVHNAGVRGTIALERVQDES